MTIPTETYEAIFDQYSCAMRWMAGLGIKLNPGRTSHYQKILGHWKDAYKAATPHELQQIFPDFVSSMFEVFDFMSIYKAFEVIPAHQLTSIIGKLQKGVNGPINVADETPESTAARIFIFEAVVAAKAHRPDRGIEAILAARSDTGISLNGQKLWVECKRVTTVNAIESNARKASSQLETILESEVGSDDRGIVALDVSKILNPGDKIFVASNDNELSESIVRMMRQFIEDHSPIWQRVYERRHEKIIGTIIKFSFMATSEARNLPVHTSHWGVNPRLDVATSDKQIQRQLAATLAAT
ncbi:MAG TPA: hypothetical protein VMV52_01960 [Candidatus Nanopelagicaceae bacterium]|nr:hypothetical protein [Candidatus Nanopelagicaceae bacterium]